MENLTTAEEKAWVPKRALGPIFVGLKMFKRRSEETWRMYISPCSKIMVLILFFCSKFPPLLHGDSPLLYNPLEVIMTLHLLIIWTFT